MRNIQTDSERSMEEHKHQEMLNDINQECSDLCSRKNPSCLRSPNKENILKFSMEHFNKELKE
jgi:hypothetical protein